MPYYRSSLSANLIIKQSYYMVEVDEMSGNEIDNFIDSVLHRDPPTELSRLMDYELFSGKADGKSQYTIDLTISALNKLRDFLIANQLPTDAKFIGPQDIRNFILHLQGSKRFQGHPYILSQNNLSAISINTYIRTIRAAFNRWAVEGFIERSPFEKVRVPKTPKKVINTFSQDQLQALFNTIDTSTPVGFRDHLLMLIYLDTACRLTEITNLRINDVFPSDRCIKVLGKGQRERVIPIGATTQKSLWKYIHIHRPEPAMPRFDHVFLTKDGRPLSKSRVEAIFKKYGRQAGIPGVRCSPHTLRHTACVFWIRNGGDIFSLQKITGHSSLEVLRGYVNLAQDDVTAAHQRYSAVDNLDLNTSRRPHRKR